MGTGAAMPTNGVSDGDERPRARPARSPAGAAANLSLARPRLAVASPAHRKGLPVFRSIAPRRGMTSAPLRRSVWAAVAALTLGASVLTGCAAGQIAQTADQIAGIDGAQGTVGQIGIHDALLATPQGKNYPKGSQAPLTLWITNDALASDTLTAITTSAGTVKISGNATVEPQSYLQIGGAGKAVTATVTGLTQNLDYGISVPMTFSFAHAGDLQLNVPIEVPEQRAPGTTTNIYPSEEPNLWDSGEVTVATSSH